MVVVSPLTSEAILGIDFLQGQQAVIDLGRRRLCLRESRCDILLDEQAPMQSCAHNQQVRASNTVKVPPRCIMEISAYVVMAVDGVWLVEEAMARGSQLAVARVVVEPASTSIPVRILNASDEPTTLYAGAVIATLQHIEPPAEVDAIDKAARVVDDGKRGEMLWNLVQECGAGLSPGERDIFYDLLLTYADVMASSTSDLGRTGRLHHHIDTGSSPPIRQPVRRISPHRREEVKELLSQMLVRGVVEPSSSPWASPVVLVQTKDGSTRFCIDYRKVNHVTPIHCCALT